MTPNSKSNPDMDDDTFDKNFIKRFKDFELQCLALIDFLKTEQPNEIKDLNAAINAAERLLEEYKRQRRRFKLEPQPLPEGMELGDLCRAKIKKRTWVKAQLYSRTPSGHHVVFLPDGSTTLVERVRPLSSKKKLTIDQETGKEKKQPQPQQSQKQPQKAPSKRHDSAVANAQKRSWKEMQQKLSKK